MDHSFNIIADFSTIPLMVDTLYVFDFDDTVVHYEGVNQSWWQRQFCLNYEIHGDYDRADRESLEDWQRMMHFVKPTHIDKAGLSQIIHHCEISENTHILILTARHKLLETPTRSALSTISDKNWDIVFCDGSHKGHKLREFLTHTSYRYIVFVDDHIQNLADVAEACPMAYCYHMQSI